MRTFPLVPIRGLRCRHVTLEAEGQSLVIRFDVIERSELAMYAIGKHIMRLDVMGHHFQYRCDSV